MTGAGYRGVRDVSPEAQAIRIEELRVDMGDLKDTQKRMAEALEKLVRMEEVQKTTSESLARAFSALKEQGERIRQLELAAAKPALLSGWVEKGILFALGALGAKALGLLGVG